MRERLFGDRVFNKKLVSLALPIALQQLMLAAVSVFDAVMLNLISQDKMSAVSLATQIAFVQNLFLAAMTIGLSTLAAQYWGKGDISSFEKIFAHAMKVTAAISFLFSVLSAVCPVFLMKIFTDEAVLIDGGAEYLRLSAPSFFFAGIS